MLLWDSIPLQSNTRSLKHSGASTLVRASLVDDLLTHTQESREDLFAAARECAKVVYPNVRHRKKKEAAEAAKKAAEAAAKASAASPATPQVPAAVLPVTVAPAPAPPAVSAAAPTAAPPQGNVATGSSPAPAASSNPTNP